MTQFGIPFEKELVRAGDYTVSSGYKAILEMESAGLDYSAVICANDLMALGAINALKELSYRIPEDVQVIGYDGLRWMNTGQPFVSSIYQDTGIIAKTSVDCLMRLLKWEKRWRILWICRLSFRTAGRRFHCQRLI